MRAFAFLNIKHPPVAWAVARGMLVSADQVHNSDGPISFMLAGMIEHDSNCRLFNESIIEILRASEFPTETSRLRGMYFFQSAHEALKRAGDPLWPAYFTAENLVEFELHPSQPVTVVDANWITHAPLDRDGKVSLSQIAWIRNYWAKQPLSENPVWEVVATGVAIALDSNVRRRCYDSLAKDFPDAEIFLLMARLAGEAGTLGGTVVPWLVPEAEGVVELKYFLRDSEFHDNATIEKLAKHLDASKLGAMMAKAPVWNLPDFRQWSRKFRPGLTQLRSFSDFALSMHNAD